MNFKIIESISDLGPFLSELATVEEVAIDVETNSLNTLTCRIYSLQVGTRNSIYIFNLLKLEKKALVYVTDLISNKVCIGHNIKYDMEVLYSYTGILLNKVFDTMLAKVLTAADPTKRLYSLGDLVFEYAGVTLDKTVRESFWANGDITELSEQQLIYMADDVKYLFEIKDRLVEEIITSKQDRVWDLECKVEPVVALMELTGIKLDSESWLKLAVTCEKESIEIKKQTIELIISRVKELKEFSNLLEFVETLKIPVTTKRGKKTLSEITDPINFDRYIREHFNLASHTQLLNVLKLLGFEVESTGSKVIADIQSDDPIITSISEYRERDVRVGSFGAKFVNAISPTDEKLHYQLNQLGTRTGRFSGGGGGFSDYEINMQQIPRSVDYRSCFIAEEGWKLVCYDFNQQEYRLAGAVTMEPRIIDAYQRGMDMHTATASLVFSVPMTEVTKAQRQTAKGFNFAILYGSTEYGLAYNFKISVAEGKRILDVFYDGYPVYKKAKEMFEDQIVKCGYATTLLGRRRYFPKPTVWGSGEDYQKYTKMTKREGFNMMIQGSGSDVTKMSMYELYIRNPFGDKFKPVLQVHDEILFTAKDEVAEDASEFMKVTMEEVESRFLGDIPAKVEGGIDTKWKH